MYVVKNVDIHCVVLECCLVVDMFSVDRDLFSNSITAFVKLFSCNILCGGNTQVSVQDMGAGKNEENIRYIMQGRNGYSQ